MIRFVFLLICVSALFACTTVQRVEPQPHSDFTLLPTKQGGSPVLPEGVAVLHEYPTCGFEAIGEVRVTHHQIAITPSRIKKLKEQAAIYGADGIIVHPNLPFCEDGTTPPVCKGRGEYVIATAIRYLDDPEPTPTQAGLEYEFKRGYDTVEFYNSDIH